MKKFIRNFLKFLFILATLSFLLYSKFKEETTSTSFKSYCKTAISYMKDPDWRRQEDLLKKSNTAMEVYISSKILLGNNDIQSKWEKLQQSVFIEKSYGSLVDIYAYKPLGEMDKNDLITIASTVRSITNGPEYSIFDRDKNPIEYELLYSQIQSDSTDLEEILALALFAPEEESDNYFKSLMQKEFSKQELSEFLSLLNQYLH